MLDECRVFAGVSGSPGSVHALRQAADLARRHDALLIPLLAWVPPDSNRLPWPELRQIWKDDAWQRLWDTVDTAFGGLPAGIDIQPVVRCGKPGQVLTGAACQPGDVLVIGAGRRGLVRRLGRYRVARYCLAHACCPVLAIPPPALAQEAGYGLRGWAPRHRWTKATVQLAQGPPHLAPRRWPARGGERLSS
jgi:nucleotide-binding universal stress UspA family protein